MKTLINKVNAADNARIRFDTKCYSALKELLKYFDFDYYNEYGNCVFYIEHQPSDGMVLADYDTMVYNLSGIIDFIKKNGSIKSYDELKQFSI